MLGILLRTPWQAIRARIHAELVAAGFKDVRPRDLAVLQWPGPDGMRAIDIAANLNCRSGNSVESQRAGKL
jgi:hypothetical protein